MRSLSCVLTLALLVATPGWVAAKDLVIHEQITGGPPGSAPRDQTVYISGNKRATESRGTRTIVDLDQKTVTVLQLSRKTYTVHTFDQLTHQMDAMKKRLESLPPEVRKMAEAKMEANSNVTVKPTGKTEKIAGYEAKEYSFEAGAVTGSLWATEALDVPYQDWAKVTGSIGPGRLGGQLAGAMSQIKGYPLRSSTTVAFGPQKNTFVNEAVEVKQEKPPADVFTIPADFKKIDVPGLPRGIDTK